MTPVLFEKGLFFRGKLLVLLRVIYNPSKYVVHDGQLDSKPGNHDRTHVQVGGETTTPGES